MNIIKWMVAMCSVMAIGLAQADDLQSWDAWENPPGENTAPPWAQGGVSGLFEENGDADSVRELSYVESDANDPGGVYSRGIGPLLDLGLSPADLASALNDVASTVEGTVGDITDIIDGAVDDVIANLPP